VAAYDTTLTEFKEYSMTSTTAQEKYTNASLPTHGPSGMKKKLIKAHNFLLNIIYQSPTLRDGYMNTYSNRKENIPIGPNANLFDDHMFNARSSNPNIGALSIKPEPYFDEHVYKDLFEDSPRKGDDLLQFVKRQCDALGLSTSVEEIESHLRMEIDELVDTEYAIYEKNTKKGNYAIKRKETWQGRRERAAKGLRWTVEKGAAAPGAAAGLLKSATQAGYETTATYGTAFSESAKTLREAMRFSGEETRRQLRKYSERVKQESHTQLVQTKADFAAIRDAIKAKSIVNTVQLHQWTKRRVGDARYATLAAMAAYESGTAAGAFEAGAGMVGSAVLAFDLATDRRRTQANINNNIRTIQKNIKEIGKLKSSYEKMPVSRTSELNKITEYLGELLDELVAGGENQIKLLEQMDDNMPESAFTELKKGATKVREEAVVVMLLVEEKIKAGAAIAKAGTQTTLEVALDIINSGIKATGKVALLTAKLGLRIGLGAASLGMSEILPAMNRAEEDRRKILVSEAMKKQRLGLPLDRLDQQALDGHRRRQGNE
jgi:hypothetical protein